jgi:hypothetical protein
MNYRILETVEVLLHAPRKNLRPQPLSQLFRPILAKLHPMGTGTKLYIQRSELGIL